MPSTARLLTKLTAIVLSIALLAPAAYAQATHSFDLPAQPLADALRAVGQQAGVNVMFEPRLVKNLKAPALKTQGTTLEALRKLLEGTQLNVVQTAPGSILISAGPAAEAKETAPADQMRLSLAGDANHQNEQSGDVAKETQETRQVTVTDTRIKPYSDRNVDLPRTIDDVQPYYIFDAKTIEQSGANNIEDFLKQRLTMNAVSITDNQQYGSNGNGNTSSINLRGLGDDHTLVLVNGRRMAGVQLASFGTQQPDVNGLPLGSIDRIEVLPTSASGIYGGGAIGGVVNIILKEDYAGAEVNATYRNTWNSDTPVRNLTATLGQVLRDGRTQFMVTGSYSDSSPLLFRDRKELLERGYARILRNNPEFFFSDNVFTLPLGATMNIINLNSGLPGNLSLKSTGASLNSHIAKLPVGYTTTSDPATIIAGALNLDFPEANSSPNGLTAQLGAHPKTKSVMATFRQEVNSWLDIFLEPLYTANESIAFFNPIRTDASSIMRLDPTTPTNPFNERIYISFPFNVDASSRSRSVSRSIAAGADLRLPHGWNAKADLSWSDSRFSRQFSDDSGYLRSDVRTGAFNPFIDLVQYPQDLSRYLRPTTYEGASEVREITIRGTGPMFRLPWVEVPTTAAAALQRRKEGNQLGRTVQIDDFNKNNSVKIDLFPQSQTITNLYVELDIPLVTPKVSRVFLNSIELQVAGRMDRYTVDSGTTSKTTYFEQTPPLVLFNGPTLNGEPYQFQSEYSSHNKTLGLRWRPLRDLMLRVSRADAFLPPTYQQLLPNPVVDSSLTNVFDRQSPIPNPLPSGCTVSQGVLRCSVQTLSGGNPELKPQNSESWNIGAVWEPTVSILKNLRVDVEYYSIDQFDKIGQLTPQQIVDAEDVYPERVDRDPTTGQIVRVDRSLLNLTKFATEGWDLNIGYRWKMSDGMFDWTLGGTVINFEKRQNVATQPMLDYVGYPNSGGEAERKGYSTLTWERGQLSAGWSVQYYGKYFQSGAGGDPGGVSDRYISAQGSDEIPTQLYHDMFVGYTFDKSRPGEGFWGGVLSGTKVQLSVKNVFDKLPPFDVYRSPYFYSTYGDMRLRDYTITVRKSFGR